MGLEYVKKGGFIDLTTSSDLEHLEKEEIRAGEALKIFLDQKLPIEHITFSSDGNGSMPRFDEEGHLLGLGICSVGTLYREVKWAIIEQNISIEEAIKVITSNVAEILKLKDKGTIECGKDADFIMVDEKSLEIEMVFAKGKKMVEGGKPIVTRVFEL